jgi:hypothetical protein
MSVKKRLRFESGKVIVEKFEAKASLTDRWRKLGEYFTEESALVDHPTAKHRGASYSKMGFPMQEHD